jgi:hypothetical protein
MKIEEKTHIGTSGWRYEHWRGPFYPGGLAIEFSPLETSIPLITINMIVCNFK